MHNFVNFLRLISKFETMISFSMYLILRKQIFSFSSLSSYYFSTSNSPFAKKKLSLKNHFTFRNEFKKEFLSETTFQGKIMSSDLLRDQQINPEDLSYSKLSLNKKKCLPPLTYRGEIVFGIHPVYLALSQKKRFLYQLYVRKDTDSITKQVMERKQEIITLAESLNIPISFVNSKSLKMLAPDSVHQGVCLDAGFLPVKCWNGDDFQYQCSEKFPLWLVLDEILDPMNVGAIIRSAYYFGVDKIFTIKGNSCKLSPVVSKASSGTLEVIDIYQLENLEDFIKNRKAHDWSIVSTVTYTEKKMDCGKQPINATEFNVSKPTILILGNEGTGISKAVESLCETFISIEPGQNLYQGVDSLNVSVAAGILLYVLNSKVSKR